MYMCVFVCICVSFSTQHHFLQHTGWNCSTGTGETSKIVYYILAPFVARAEMHVNETQRAGKESHNHLRSWMPSCKIGSYPWSCQRCYTSLHKPFLPNFFKKQVINNYTFLIFWVLTLTHLSQIYPKCWVLKAAIKSVTAVLWKYKDECNAVYYLFLKKLLKSSVDFHTKHQFSSYSQASILQP